MLPDLQASLRAHRSAAQLGFYDGQRRVGTIIEVEGKALAFDAFGNCLGSFGKRRDAMGAVPRPAVLAVQASLEGAHG
jgi:hypothetical protein